MSLVQIDASILQRAFIAGAKSLEAKKEWINELNVFPVPDGDTGTNMTMTIMSAAKEVAAIKNPDIESVCKAISSGSLRGARGNSGVILSQLFRGFTKGIKDVDIIDTTVLAHALENATQTAYKAVMKPKEGTILTVSKGISDKALEISDDVTDILEFAKILIEEGDRVLASTPDMLPVLKQAGVVDSGGQGLMQILKGVYDGLSGKEIDYSIEVAPSSSGISINTEHIDTADIKFGYCTEFIINTEKEFDEMKFKAFLESIGDSIVCVADEDVVKIHVHTNDPGRALQEALGFGSLSRIKIDNMREEHEEKLIKDASKIAKQMEQEKAVKADTLKKTYGIISVSVGEGLGEIFKGIGADYLIEGGQTMNPSTEDILNAIDRVNAENIFILPNNKNIVLAANQAAQLTEDKNIIVIPSKTIPQGINALIGFMPDVSVEENTENMLQEMANVKTGQITYAVRNTNIDGYDIKEGDIMGIGDSGMLTVQKDIKTCALEAIKALVDESTELISIYYGADITEEAAGELVNILNEEFEDLEVEINYGGQPVYYYLISIE